MSINWRQIISERSCRSINRTRDPTRCIVYRFVGCMSRESRETMGGEKRCAFANGNERALLHRKENKEDNCETNCSFIYIEKT